MITDLFSFIRLKLYPKTNISLLKNERYFIDNLRKDGIRIAAFHPKIHRIFVPIGKTSGALTECPNPTNPVKHISVCQHRQQEEKKQPLPDGKQRSKSIPTTHQQDNQDENHIKPTGQNHFGTSTLSIRRCVTFTGE